jgi:hypothetical protein
MTDYFEQVEQGLCEAVRRHAHRRGLRHALAQRAAEVPHRTTARLRQIGHRPRSPRVQIALALGGAASIVAAAAIIVSIVGLGAGTQRAFAGWSPTPTSPVGAQTVTAEEACRSRLPRSAAIEHAQETASGSRGPSPVPRFGTGDWQTVLTDVRGPYTVTLFVAAEGKAVFSCFSGRDSGEASLGGALGTHTPAPVGSGQISVVSAGGNVTPPDEGSAQFSRLFGRTGAGVTAVAVQLTDGTRVTATTSNGWFLAWWPGTARASAAEVTSSNGTITQPVGGVFGALAGPAGTD